MHENNLKYLRSKHFNGGIRALYSKVTIGSLTVNHIENLPQSL